MQRRFPAAPVREAETRTAPLDSAVGARRGIPTWPRVVLTISAAMFAIELLTAAGTASTSLTIAALRSGSDVAVAIASLAAQRQLADTACHAGLRFDVTKLEALIGFVTGLALLGASVPLAYHAAADVFVAGEVDGDTAPMVLGFGIVMNIALATWLLSPWGSARSAHARSDGTSDALKHQAVANQFVDAELSVLLLAGHGVAGLFGWPAIGALAALVGAFVLSVSAARVLTRHGTRLVDMRTDDPGPQTARDV